MSIDGIKGFARDALLAIAIAFGCWFVYMQFMAPRPISAGPAPVFSLQDLDGEDVGLPQEGVVVLNFWFTSCPPCRHEIPELSSFHAAHPDVAFYGVSVDKMGARRLEVLSSKLGITYPVLRDPDSRVARSYGVSLFPTTVVIDDGEIAAVRTGEVNQASLEGLVLPLL